MWDCLEDAISYPTNSLILLRELPNVQEIAPNFIGRYDGKFKKRTCESPHRFNCPVFLGPTDSMLWRPSGVFGMDPRPQGLELPVPQPESQIPFHTAYATNVRNINSHV